jgi:hypothetical protein
MQYARASVAAIAAVMALSPTYAARPKPIVDLSQSPALNGQDNAAPASKKDAQPDRTTIELGAGALALLVAGGAAVAISSRRRRREQESWQFDEQSEAAMLPEPAPPMNIAEGQPAMVPPPMSAFDLGNGPRRETADSNDCEQLESWVDRAKCGPTPDNPSQSLKKRLKRAAFFEKRDREVAAGEAAPIDPDAGLPESLEETA